MSRRSLLVAGTAMLVAGCTRDRTKPLITEEEPDAGLDLPGAAATAALRAILARRAKAVQTGDEGMFLGDLDQSRGALIKQQKMLFANLRQFTFKTFAYVLPERVQPQVDKGLSTFPVVGIVQLAIDDAGTGVMPGEAFRYTLIQQDGRFLVRDIVGKTRANAAELDVQGPMADAPWNTTPLRVTTVGDVWLAADASVTDLDAYVSAAAAEADRIDALWGGRTRYPGSLMFLTRDAGAFKTWYGFGQADNYEDTVEGIAPFRVGVRTNGEVFDGQFAGSRVVVNLKRIDAFDDDPRLVMRHELAHAITTRAQEVGIPLGELDSGAPTWAVEGFAQWTETLGNAGRAAQSLRGARTGFNGRLPRSKDFYGKKATQNYAVGATAFLFAEKLKGTQAAVEFYAAVVRHADLGDDAVAELPVFDGICREALGLSSASFYRRWAGFVRNGA
ncbi:hypothetical protein AB0J80_04885 [Actinoplanes sp. NPDC049548]|uniref:hypothetical protein n=1 Tax=Actinoplanes sp. NPDC049548 TaxID=3155152 RepID=UPI00343CF0C2